MNVVYKLLSEFDLSGPPLDLEELVRHFNVAEVRTVNLGSTSGMLVRSTPNKGALILLNSREPELRRRFTLAHEIGHLLFGSSHVQRRSAKETSAFYSTDDSDEEQLCNAFAAELLMPISWMDRYLTPANASLQLIRDLSSVFRVSAEAAALRMGSLSTADVQVICWRARKKTLRPYWRAGRKGFLDRNFSVSMDDTASSAALAFRAPFTIQGYEYVEKNGNLRRFRAESEGYGPAPNRYVISVLRGPGIPSKPPYREGAGTPP